MGEKPVYYGWQNCSFLFGSELKALKAHPKFKNNINRDSLSLLMRHNTISSPHSIYEGIKALLKDDGVFIFEDPYLGEIIEKTSFDQIYDEHVFLFSALSVSHLANMHNRTYKCRTSNYTRWFYEIYYRT